jgi:outer membrane scaffolding protein for murein synthesis (MipA/OmpV family)
MQFRQVLVAAGASLGALVSVAAHSEEKPLWEAGLGIGALRFPDYRGSDEAQVFPVPVPYLVYRGEFLKADREGVRGELFNRKYAELSISADASIPVRSKDNAARRGMRDLKPTVELGPSFDLHVWRSADQRMKLDVVMPLRGPITVEASPRSIGVVFAPRVNLDIADVAGYTGWNFGVGLGPIFADDKFHSYFYSVTARDVRPDRPVYDAGGGYSGSHLLVSLSKRFPKYWVGAYMRYDSLAGAAFADSPLVRQQNYIAGGFGIAWMIGESRIKVQTDE